MMQQGVKTTNLARYGSYAGLAMLLLACSGRQAAWQSTTPAAAAEPTSTEAETTSGEEQADPVQAKRDEAARAWETRLDEASLNQAISLWEEVVTAAPADHETWTSLSRAYYFLSDGHLRFQEDADEAMLETFGKSVTAAEKALMAMSPEFAAKMADGAKIEEAVSVLGKDAVSPLYWRSASLGKWASKKGFAYLVKHKDAIRAIMKHCLDSDPDFFFNGPDRYFGAFYARAPGWAGGDLDKSQEHFEKSMAAQPNYLGTRVLMAQDLEKKRQDRARYEQLLNEVIEADPNVLPGAEPENAVEQRKAKLLLEQAEEIFE